ncbi:MAG: GTPase HflX [Puniceicoccaceae bacterium]
MFDVREKPKMVERAYLVGIAGPGETEEEAASLLEELEDLVCTLEIGIVGKEVARMRQRQARYLLGSGKMEEIVNKAKALKADCLVFDAELSPAQQRNWESASGILVIDREEVILDIFSERASTREAVLQVELARAQHSLPRLKNAWTHLSRQRGGGGVTQRGEGEAQIELDARMVRQRIAKLRKELEAVVRHRQTQRKQRQKVPVPTAAIVGYTNAGKSTLLNSLTGADVLSEDKLFATLDPTTRQLQLPAGQKLLLTDTVGFVRRLPHQLVEAFKATLEEAVLADFLVHVVDVSNPEYKEQEETTFEVLKELGAEDKSIVTVYNKIDQCEESLAGGPRSQKTAKIYASAHTCEGLDLLIQEFERQLENRLITMELLIPFNRYDLVSQLHDQGTVREEHPEDNGVYLVGNVPARLRASYEPYITKM